MTALFALTLFCSALLLFLVQPLLGKLLLPLLGGTPAVWNTCLVFFQGALLCGYLHVHLFTNRFRIRTQARWHLLLLCVPVLDILAGWYLTGTPMPVFAELLPEDQDHPVLSLLLVLFLAVGVTFFVLSTTAPLLQRWYAALSPANRDPYTLYAASNAGSLLGLLGYPLLVEPQLTLSMQKTMWIQGVYLCLGLIAICSLWTTTRAPDVSTTNGISPALPRGKFLRWTALAALPTLLLSASTTHLTTDIAPVPLLWVVPLALYLLSFILVFSHWSQRVHVLVGRWTAILLVLVIFLLAFGAVEPIAIVAGLHLLMLFAVCLVCHGELALDRPAKEHMTAFYLCLAVGGVLGSLFCALLAPIVFMRLGLLEYPLGLLVVAFLRPGKPLREQILPLRVSDFLLPAGLAALTVVLVRWTPTLLGPAPPDESINYLPDRIVRGGLMYGVPVILAFAMAHRPTRYALALSAVLLAGVFDTSRHGAILYTSRNFFGTLRISRSEDGRFIRLVHGTTQHGQERIGDEPHPTPLMYYYPTGPAGRVFRALPNERMQRVGLVGLGCGALASYGRPGQKWTFYEIDPAVIRLAQDTTWFHYLSGCPAELDVVPGDARRQLRKTEANEFDVLVLDAFSSDAIPMHLLTREALELYLNRLKDNGLLLFHVSNRYLDLPPLLRRTASAIDPSLVVRVDNDIPTGDEKEKGKYRSIWVVIARRDTDLRFLKNILRWERVQQTPGPMWTDDFSNLLGVWREE